MNITQAKNYIGCKVMSHDPGVKLIPSVSKAHGPYILVKITKNGMAQLDGYREAVAPRHLEKCPKPDKQGIWEWFDELGRKRLVDVVNVEFNPAYPKCLRVACHGGYYNVNEETDVLYSKDGTCSKESFVRPAEWPDRWGSYIGPRGCVTEEELYSLFERKIVD